MYRVAGDTDYILRVIVSDTPAFNALYGKLNDLTPTQKITSRVVLETIKSESAFSV